MRPTKKRKQHEFGVTKIIDVAANVVWQTSAIHNGTFTASNFDNV